MGRGRHGNRPAPVSSVLQSPKDLPVEFFEDADRPRSARLSDKPGSAFSGLRPRSFSRVKGPSRSRVSSIEEEDIKTGKQPLVSHSFSGGFGRSESSIGADRTIYSRKIAGSRSGESDGRGRTRTEREHQRRLRSRSRSSSRTASGSSSSQQQQQRQQEEEDRRPPSSTMNGNASPGPPNRTHTLLRHQQPSIGTALSAIDKVQSVAASRHLAPSTAGASKNAMSAIAARRASVSGPVRYDRNALDGASAFDSPTGEKPATAVLPRRSSASQLVSLATSGSMELATTIGTPLATPAVMASATRASMIRLAGERPGGARSLFHQRGSSVSAFGIGGGGGDSVPGVLSRKAPRNLPEAIEAGDVLAVGALVRAMTQEEAEVELVAQDREEGTPLMQAAARKNVQTYRAVMDAIRSRLGVETLMNELQARDLRQWCPLMHAAWSGSADVFRAVVVAIEDNLGRDQVAEQLASTAKHGWTPLHAAARGNAEAMGAVMTALVNYMEADELKEQLSQSHDKDSDLPTPLMFAAASSSLDSRSLSPLLSELLGCMCDVDEERRQRTAVYYAAWFGRLDTLSCLIAYGCEITDQTVTKLLSGDLAVGRTAFNRCVWRGITTARNPLIPAHNVLRAVSRAADRVAKHRQFLLRVQADVNELVQEILQQLPTNMAGFAENQMDTGQGFAAVQWLLEPEMAGKRIATFTGPLARALEIRRLEFFSTNIVLAYITRKFTRGLPGVFSGASWKMPDMHNRDTKRFVLGLPYGAAPDNIVGAVRMRLCVPFELIQGSALRRTSLVPGLQFNCVGLASRPDAFYEVPAVRMAFDVVSYLIMLILFCIVVKLDDPDDIPAAEWAFYAYTLGTMVNELGEAKYVRRLRGQSELWNIVEAVLLGLICAAFTARMVAFAASVGQDEAFFLAQLFFAIAAPLFFSRVLFLSQIDEHLGLLVQILFRMLKEVVRFGVVICVILLGFSMAMYALFGGSAPSSSEEESTTSSLVGETDGDDDTEGDLRFLQSTSSVSATQDPATFDISEVYLPSYSTYSETALTMFRAMFGDFDLDEFAGVRYGQAGVGLMVAFLVIMGIMLLNLLIAFLSGAHTLVQKQAKAKFHFTRTQIVQHWDRVVEHDVLPAPINLVHMTMCLALKLCVGKHRYPTVQMRIGCLLFWLVMGPLGAALALCVWFVSLPWSLYHLCFGGQANKEVDRRSERLKYVVTAPGLIMIAFLLGFLSIFVGDGSSDGASGLGRQASRNARRDRLGRGGDFDLAGLLRKVANIGVDDLRRQLKNPLKDPQVLPRDAKIGTTVEHVKQLRDDITNTTSQTFRETLGDHNQMADERSMRLDARLSALEQNVSQIRTLLENIAGQPHALPPPAARAMTASNASTTLNSRSSHRSGE